MSRRTLPLPAFVALAFALSPVPALAQVGISIDKNKVPGICKNSGNRPSTRCERWWRIWNPPGSTDGWAWGSVVSPDSETVFVTGRHDNASAPSEAATIAYDAALGYIVWSQRVPDAQAVDVAVQANGERVFVTGNTYADGPSGYEGSSLTIAYDAATGAELWRDERKGSADYAYNSAVAVDPIASRVYTVGTSNGYFVNAFDAETGAHLWEYEDNVVGGPGASGSYASSIAVSPTCTFVAVSGTGAGGGSYGLSTVVLDSGFGTEVWQDTWGGTRAGGGLGLAASFTPDGSRLLVTGGQWVNGKFVDRHNWALLAYDAGNGDLDWVGQYEAWDSYDYPHAMTIASDSSRVVLTGSERITYYLNGGYVSRQMMTVAFDADGGAELWAVPFSAGRFDFGHDVTITPDGSTVVAAGSTRPLYVPLQLSPNDFSLTGEYEYDNLVVGYDAATGAELWRNVWAGPEAQRIGYTEILPVLAMAPDGSRVFCSASRWLYNHPSTSGSGFLTLSFDPNL